MIRRCYMGIFGIFRKTKEKRHLGRKERIKNRAVRKLEKLKLHKENAHDEFSDITKNFFKDLLHIKYEFTYKELAKELGLKKIKKELKDEILKFHDEFSNLKYGSEGVSRGELEEAVARIKRLIKEL